MASSSLFLETVPRTLTALRDTRQGNACYCGRLQALETYLQGSKHSIEVWSDHKNLRAFMKQPRLNGRQARWLIALTPYDFTIHHRPGDFNPAEGPSRRPDYMRETTVNPDLNHFLPTLTSKFAKVHSIGCNELSVPTLAKVPESCRRWRKTRVEEPQSQVRADTRTIEQTVATDARGASTPILSVPTLAKGPESCRRWRKTRVEEPQSQVRTAIRDCRADTRTIDGMADARGAPTPKALPDCVSEAFCHRLLTSCAF